MKAQSITGTRTESTDRGHTFKTETRTFTYADPNGNDVPLRDRLHRVMGAQVETYEIDVIVSEDQAPEHLRWCPGGTMISFTAPGHYYGYRPQATRDGNKYGAWQYGTIYTTKEDRDKAVETYFTNAKKRALKTAGRWI
jgi:hypothetical protein